MILENWTGFLAEQEDAGNAKKIELFRAWYDSTANSKEEKAALAALMAGMNAVEKERWAARSGQQINPEDFKEFILGSGQAAQDAEPASEPEQSGSDGNEREEYGTAGTKSGLDDSPDNPDLPGEEQEAQTEESDDERTISYSPDVFEKVKSGDWDDGASGKAFPNANEEIVKTIHKLQFMVGAKMDGVFGSETARKIRQSYYGSLN